MHLLGIAVKLQEMEDLKLCVIPKGEKSMLASIGSIMHSLVCSHFSQNRSKRSMEGGEQDINHGKCWSCAVIFPYIKCGGHSYTCLPLCAVKLCSLAIDTSHKCWLYALGLNTGHIIDFPSNLQGSMRRSFLDHVVWIFSMPLVFRDLLWSTLWAFLSEFTELSLTDL